MEKEVTIFEIYRLRVRWGRRSLLELYRLRGRGRRRLVWESALDKPRVELDS